MCPASTPLLLPQAEPSELVSEHYDLLMALAWPMVQVRRLPGCRGVGFCWHPSAGLRMPRLQVAVSNCCNCFLF